MSSQITIDAKLREKRGKNEARRLRAQGLVPVTIYGHGEPVAAAVDGRKLAAIFRAEAGHNTIFNLNLDNETPAVIIKDWDVDPVKGRLVHADLFRLKLDEVMRVAVPVQIVGTPTGVKIDGGILEVQTHELNIECLPGSIPEHIDIDVTGLRVNEHLNVADLRLPEGIKILNEPEQVIAAVIALRATEEGVTPSTVAGPAEPEVIKKGKTETE